MARAARPLYIVTIESNFATFQDLMRSGDLAAMKAIVARAKEWFADPANASDPEAEDQRSKIEQLKTEIARLEGQHKKH